MFGEGVGSDAGKKSRAGARLFLLMQSRIDGQREVTTTGVPIETR
jgi:hypothetical protein